MRATGMRLTQGLIAVGFLVLAMTAATPALAKGSSALRIRAVSLEGNRVVVTVTGVAATKRADAVTSRVLVRIGSRTVSVPVTVGTGQTETVDLPLANTDKLGDELPLGVVVDDGVPF